MIYGRQLLHSFLVTSMYTHTYIVSFYQQKYIFVFVGETYAHSNPLLILVNLCEVSSIHFITMMDHHWGGSWGGVSIYIYIYIYAELDYNYAAPLDSDSMVRPFTTCRIAETISIYSRCMSLQCNDYFLLIPVLTTKLYSTGLVLPV